MNAAARTMRSVAADHARDAIHVTLTLGAVVTAATLVVTAWFAPSVRHLLAFTFPGPDHYASTALATLLNNARLLAAVLGACLVAQAPWLGEDLDAKRGPVARSGLAVTDAVLALAVLANTALVGLAIGAYGDRMMAALLPHGPVEVAAFVLALSLYLRARREPLGARAALATVTACLLLLALAATLETFLGVKA